MDGRKEVLRADVQQAHLGAAGLDERRVTALVSAWGNRSGGREERSPDGAGRGSRE